MVNFKVVLKLSFKMKSLLPLIVLLFVSCQKSADSILEDAIVSTGVLSDQDSLHFEKKTSLFLADGSLEKTQIELHGFHSKPFWYQIERLSTPSQQTFEMRVNRIFTSDENNYSEAQIKAFETAVYTSRFVLYQPHVFKDEKANIIRLKDSVFFDQKCYQLQIVFDDNSNDIWKLFINKNSGLVEGYDLMHNGKKSIIHNEKMTQSKGVWVPSKRSSYMFDQDKAFVRAKYWYTYTDK